MDFKTSKDYIEVESILFSLEHQLESVEQLKLQDFNAMKREIEHYFQECVRALTDRKNSLLTEVASIAQLQGAEISKTKENLMGRIKGCKEILNAGANVYKAHPSIAEHIWQGARILSLPNFKTEQLPHRADLNLPTSLLDIITSYGDISLSGVSMDDSLALSTSSIQPTYISTVISAATISTSLPAVVTSPDISAGTTSKFAEVNTITTFAELLVRSEDGNLRTTTFLTAICFSPKNNYFYICDRYNHTIQRITQLRAISEVVVVKSFLSGIAVYEKESMLFFTCGTALFKVPCNTNFFGPKPTILAGDLHAPLFHQDGYGTNAKFKYPDSITIDQRTGNIYVCDVSQIRVVTQQGELSTLAGHEKGFKDGNKSEARFGELRGICFDQEDQSLMVCDFDNDAIRRVLLNGEVSTIWKVKEPQCIAIIESGNFLLASEAKIYRLFKQGHGRYALQDIARTARRAEDSRFVWPTGIVVHKASNSCYVSDNNKIRKIQFY